jgi:hypothetical protein
MACKLYGTETALSFTAEVSIIQLMTPKRTQGQSDGSWMSKAVKRFLNESNWQMWVVSTGTALTYACFAVHQSILYNTHNKKVRGNTAYLKFSINREFTHTHTHTKWTCNTWISSCKRGRGTEVIHLTTLTIVKIYIMLLVDEWNMNMEQTVQLTGVTQTTWIKFCPSTTLSTTVFTVYVKDVQQHFTGLPISNKMSIKHYM